MNGSSARRARTRKRLDIRGVVLKPSCVAKPMSPPQGAGFPPDKSGGDAPPLAILDYLQFFDARADRYSQAFRFYFNFCPISLALIVTGVVAFVTNQGSPTVSYLAIIAGIALTVSFALGAYYYAWYGSRFEQMCWKIVNGKLRSPEQILPCYRAFVKISDEKHCVMAKLSELRWWALPPEP